MNLSRRGFKTSGAQSRDSNYQKNQANQARTTALPTTLLLPPLLRLIITHPALLTHQPPEGPQPFVPRGRRIPPRTSRLGCRRVNDAHDL